MVAAVWWLTFCFTGRNGASLGSSRSPKMELAGKPVFVESAFLNQLKSLPVQLSR